jgi:hypothetical protein
LALGEAPLCTQVGANAARGDVAALGEVGLGRGQGGGEDQSKGFDEHCLGAGSQEQENGTIEVLGLRGSQKMMVEMMFGCWTVGWQWETDDGERIRGRAARDREE